MKLSQIMQELKTYSASLSIGLLLGFIGAGGSIVAIPVFIYILKKDPISSSIYSMFVVGISSMAGSIPSIINKTVDFKVALVFGVPSMVGVFIARKIIFPLIPVELFTIGSFSLSRNFLFMLCLSTVMFLAALRILKPLAEIQPGHDDKSGSALLIPRGFFVGIFTGLMGIGGGFLIVPALYFLAKSSLKKAIGTALFIITFNSLFSFLNSYTSINIDWSLLIKFSTGAIIGIIIGTGISKKIPTNYLKKIFGWFIFSMSLYIIYRQLFSNRG
jgi:uncharacterized protein